MSIPADQSKPLLSALMTSVQDGVFVVDRNWKVVMMNAAAEELTGFSLSDWSERFCRNLFHTNCCEEGCPLFDALKNGVAVFDRPVDFECKNGTRIETRVSCSEFKDSNGESAGGVIVFKAAKTPPRMDCSFSESDRFEGIIGRHRSMIDLFEQIDLVSGLDSTVLLTGESGTGKELVANAIVQRSRRRNNPYVKVNCGVLAETLLESELFGHVRGAFTGAYSDHPGRFELAHTGTILLDEISEASPAVQLKLLRVLQEREYERVGGAETVKIDVRVIATTNRDLRDLIPLGKFREDLYYRLSTVPITLPPLRVRGNDILLLIEGLLENLKRRTGHKSAVFSDEALDKLVHYPWPGNVRQLENVLEYSLIRARGEIVFISHLPPEVRDHSVSLAGASENDLSERTQLLITLRECRWNRQQASAKLGISRTTLWRQMQRHGIQKS